MNPQQSGQSIAPPHDRGHLGALTISDMQGTRLRLGTLAGLSPRTLDHPVRAAAVGSPGRGSRAPSASHTAGWSVGRGPMRGPRQSPLCRPPAAAERGSAGRTTCWPVSRRCHHGWRSTGRCNRRTPPCGCAGSDYVTGHARSGGRRTPRHRARRSPRRRRRGPAIGCRAAAGRRSSSAGGCPARPSSFPGRARRHRIASRPASPIAAAAGSSRSHGSACRRLGASQTGTACGPGPADGHRGENGTGECSSRESTIHRETWPGGRSGGDFRAVRDRAEQVHRPVRAQRAALAMEAYTRSIASRAAAVSSGPSARRMIR